MTYHDRGVGIGSGWSILDSSTVKETTSCSVHTSIYMYMANSQYLMYFSAQCMLQSASSHKPGAARVHVATCGGGVLTDPATSIFSLMRCSSFSCARLMLASSRCRCACSRSRSMRRSFSRSTRSSNARRRSYQQQQHQHFENYVVMYRCASFFLNLEGVYNIDRHFWCK